MQPKSNSMEKIKLIGNGNIGSSIAKFLESKAYKFNFYKSSSNDSFSAKDEDIETIFYFFAIPDDKVIDLINSLHRKNVRSIYIYFSATISRSQFSKKVYDHVLQLHPMYTFPNRKPINLSRIAFLLNGTNCNKAKIRELFSDIQFIEGDIQFLEAYHLLGIFSSNFQIALMQICKNLAEKNQISYIDLKRLLIPIMRKTIENIEMNEELSDALSGPVKRGDKKTIAKHKNYLEKHIPNYLDLYQFLTKELEKMLRET